VAQGVGPESKLPILTKKKKALESTGGPGKIRPDVVVYYYNPRIEKAMVGGS
jgi:hypothetical protein